jgi:hypothetical protein
VEQWSSGAVEQWSSRRVEQWSSGAVEFFSVFLLGAEMLCRVLYKCGKTEKKLGS